MNVSSPTPRRWGARNVTAVLGPTNTGKTHLAIERMLGHETGLIGLPLRLLAREVYGRIVSRVGEENVALVTGEEKIVPGNARYVVSTVEAMPLQTDAAFVAIDEIQIAADLERGHVFTDRILNLRGSQETLLLGADTMRGIIERLLPGVHVVTRPRMSVLSYAGQKKLTRLPERSAVVTFSADDVYAIGELIRRQRGGAAVVLGALSPRTRNKQVEIYQSGDVDFLIATDAIGMGLNLDVDHVAFAANQKFDGYQHRPLTAAELGQVAGRAGRHMRDGTFGVTGRVDPFPPPLVEALEMHRFEPVRVLQWRNDELDFSGLDTLRASLEQTPDHEGLTRAPAASDQVALEALAADPEIADRVREPADVERLWSICRIPDYRKIAPAQHNQLVRQLADFLLGGGVISDDWIAREVKHSSGTDGDIDTLSHRIAQVRTWTFVANQTDWVADPIGWRNETRTVEDKLSDALHERLTQRFVDRRTSVLMKRLRENSVPEAEIAENGDVLVEGQHVGSLSGFRFTPEMTSDGPDAKALRNAAQQALASAINERAGLFSRAADGDILLSSDGHLRWRGAPVARLVAGDVPLRPRAVLLADEHLTGPARDQVDTRLSAWISAHIETQLKPLIDLESDQSLSGVARGLAYRLVEEMGILDRRDVLHDVRGLDQTERAGLRRHGVRFGAYHIFIPALLKPGPSGLLARLSALAGNDPEPSGLAELHGVSASGRTSIDVDPSFAPELYRRYGFRIFGRRAVRIDILERLADLIRPALDWRRKPVPKAPKPDSPAATEAADKSSADAIAETPANREIVATGQAEGPAGTTESASTRPASNPQEAGEPESKGVAKAEPISADGEAASENNEEQTEAETPASETAKPAAEQTATPDEPKEPAEPQRPDGAVDGGGFTVTPAMTSLLGASGEDIATILRGLGYRLERRPLPDAEPDKNNAEQQDSKSTEDTALASKSATNTVQSSEAEEGSDALAGDAGTEDQTEETAEADTEPKFLEIWRPSRQGRGPRNDEGRNGRRNQRKGRAGGEGTATEHKGKQHNKGDKGKFKGGSGKRGDRSGKPMDRGPHRSGGPNRNRPPRDRPVDPDNPFAALAALKKDLEKTRGD